MSDDYFILQIFGGCMACILAIVLPCLWYGDQEKERMTKAGFVWVPAVQGHWAKASEIPARPIEQPQGK